MENTCSRILLCGHSCGGIREETQCLPCLHGCNSAAIHISGSDLCTICQTQNLKAAPSILLECGHAFHAHCCRSVLERRWPGPRISFTYMLCPICKRDISHPSLDSLMQDSINLRADVRRKAMARLEYEGLKPSSVSDLVEYAMAHYAYYICNKCDKPYYGGAAVCEQQVALAYREINPSEMICGACSNVTRAQSCIKHGNDFIAYKCRYCCSLAVFFCFGTTHFCTACHDDHSRLTSMPLANLPRCPAGPKAVQLSGHCCPLNVQHPATGHEFALGCGICYNAYSF